MLKNKVNTYSELNNLVFYIASNNSGFGGNNMKLKRDTTALVKDLELQIDYLIGYAPASNHWKHEYYIRKTLLDDTILNAPQEIVDKLNRIEEALYKLRNNEKHFQGYMALSELDYKFDHKILVNDYAHGESYYI